MLNENILEIESKNAFAEVTKKITEYKEKNSNAELVSLGIGDVSRPIVKDVIEAMHKAVDDLSTMENFKGYGAYYGYDFLREKILENEYGKFGFSTEEIYVSNGTKTDTTSILELFDINSKILITNPMYPIYRDGAKCLNRNVYIMNLLESDNFIPKVPKEKYDLIYMCSPNNPIGNAYSKDDLNKWMKYAKENNSVILYDNVYEAFITTDNVPHSIYELDGAKDVAIEFRSFSKKASFTGVRCSYFVIPNEISENINYLWKKRTINRFNGADYIAQRGAEATYLQTAKQEIDKNIRYYLENAKCLRDNFEKCGFKVWGGIDSPFMWVKTKNGLSSWEMFNEFLEELNIIIIPGIIFGNAGDGYFRASALGNKEQIEVANERIRKYYEEKF